MTIIFNSHPYKYEIESVCKMFFSIEKFEHEYDSKIGGRNDVILTRLKKGRFTTRLMTVVVHDNKIYKSAMSCDNHCENYKADCERILATTLYHALTKLTGLCVDWGIMTGIRPVKQIHHLSDRGYKKNQIEDYFLRDYLVSKQKFDLCLDTAKNQHDILNSCQKNDYSLYVSVPFCPTRCSYCSFVSSAISTPKAKALVCEYTKKLCEELKFTAEILSKTNLRLKSVYIGGGTPTTLSAEQLKLVCDTINENFDLSQICEYTIEAGRADTITKEKLEVIADAKADRISINPQSFNDAVLKNIGRKHSAQDAIDCYEMAKKIGFKSINMDFIAGLPLDTLDSFKATIDRAIALAPQNITVHALTVKRSSNLYDDKNFHASLIDPQNAYMVDYAKSALSQNGYIPYYLYRQKNTVQNLENVGYSKKGFECAYNVFIMDEIHSIIAVGAGGVTKIVNDDKTDIHRNFNFKYPFEYVNNFEEILKRKKTLNYLQN